MTRADKAPILSPVIDDLSPTFLDEATRPDFDSGFDPTQADDDNVFKNVANSEPQTLELWVDNDPSSSWSSPRARRS